MSEYQYYEFIAIERPLSKQEMAELRAVSTRATITPMRLTNHYEWGALKANPADWMQRYFDAFVYLANWLTCQLSLRFPKAAFSKSQLQPFVHSTLSIKASKQYWVLDWVLEEGQDDVRFSEDDGEGWMQRLLPLREELLRGDLRALYLGWLVDAPSLPDTTHEPPLPAGLAELSPAQQALVEFLEIDPDWLDAASQGSPARKATADKDALSAWLATWSPARMGSILKQIASGHGQAAEREVMAHYAAWLKTQRPDNPSDAPARTIAELRTQAKAVASQRQKREARVKARREAELRRKREAELCAMMTRADVIWNNAQAQILRGASGYDPAVRLLVDLAEGYALLSRHDDFAKKLQQFLAPHSKRSAFMRRLEEARLRSKPKG